MFEKIISFSIAQRWLVIMLTLALAALGIFSYQRLPIDAVPDITNVQVQVNTAAPGYSPLEAEQRISFSHRNRNGRPAQPATNSLTVTLWLVASDHHLQGWHRYLLCPPARQ